MLIDGEKLKAWLELWKLNVEHRLSVCTNLYKEGTVDTLEWILERLESFESEKV
jgi:hypothetical protein